MTFSLRCHVFISFRSHPSSRTVLLAQSTDSGQLIAATVIKMFHAMKLPVQDLRGLGIQVQLLEGSHSAHNNVNGLRTRSIKEMLLSHASTSKGWYLLCFN